MLSASALYETVLQSRVLAVALAMGEGLKQVCREDGPVGLCGFMSFSE